jgi:DUF4097 and DUF4098 domain-containing protein YvlB
MGVILVAFGALASPAIAGDEEPHEWRFEVKPDVRVQIEILSGRIEVRATDDNEVRVRAEGGGGLEVKGSRRRVSLRAPATTRLPWARGVDVELEVLVPRQSRVTARIVNGPIEVEGVEGELDVHAANGPIEVDASPREAFLETMNSPIRFSGDRSAVVARTLNGEIELTGVSGDVEASALSGRIRVEGEAIERAELRTMSGAIDFDASLLERARVTARTYSGAVRMRLPADVSARFDVRSHSGGVRSEFASRLTDDEAGQSAWIQDTDGRLNFAIGTGDARISIESFSGGVEIEER